MKNILILSLTALFLISCGDNTAQQNNDASENGESAPETYGATITPDGAIPLAELPAQLEGKDSITIKVKGRVSDVCQAKGCWMELIGGSDDVEPLFVKFKDYEFFMPKDLGDSEVVIRGKAYRSVTTVDELKHYAEDEGLSQEEIDAITEPKEELKFMADGVYVTDRL